MKLPRLNMSPAIACVFALLTQPYVWSQPIHGPDRPVPEHHLIQVEVEHPLGAAWLVLPSTHADLSESEDGRRLVMTAPPGTYTILAAVQAEGRPVILRLEVTIVDSSQVDTRDHAPPAVDSATEGLEQAARDYVRAVPQALLQVSEQVRSGRMQNVNQAVDLVAARREEARKAYGLSLDDASASLIDSTGRILFPAKYADLLERAARAMGASR